MRANLIIARSFQRMHDKQYKEYTKLEQTNDAQSPNADGCDESSSKSTVPTIKSKCLIIIS